ncbi:hypothetical protein J6590_059187, partial [Homalodisca vitripennis]
VSLCVCLTAVSGMPAAKRLPIPHDTDDVLAGSDFLSMFMQRSMRTADRPDGPFEPHHYDHDLNSVIHPHPHLSAKYKISDIYKTAKYGYAVSEMPSEAEDYQVTTPPVSPTLESEVRTTTQFVDPTTIQDIPTTIDDVSDRLATNFTIEEQAPTVLTGDDSTRPETTTQQTATEKVEEQVISVRVSSSVVRHSHRVETSTARSTPEVVSQPRRVDENLVSTLVTQDQPTITAVQRSEFAVEEASLSDSEATNHRQSKAQSAYDREEEVEGKVQEVSRYNNRQQTRLNGELPVFEIHFHNAPPSLISNYGSKTETQTIEDEVPALRRKEFRQLSPYPQQTEPVSYQSRVSSATSDSSVHYYRDHSRSNPLAVETVNRPAQAEPFASAQYAPDQDKPSGSSSGDSEFKETPVYHEEPRERTYGEPEKVYGRPEVNYEVDEAVSVITNGKAHGAQVPTPVPQPSEDPTGQNKFGYVVEGRNFRKYRVEERTADGFIVGEYGVVSHDDGSLRGVRYTADSTINPRLIYDTLVKFLSLK